MTLAPDIATDLVTPLGAYLRLRRRGRAAFLLESVERGRLATFAVGCGSHLCYLAEAEACGEPVMATSPTTTRLDWSRPSPHPTTVSHFPRAASSWLTCSFASTTCSEPPR